MPFQIGQTIIDRVEEAHGPAFPPSFLLPDWDPEILKEHGDWLLPRHYHTRSDRFITSLHSWVVRTKHHTILVDTCAGNHKNRPHSPLFHMKDTPYLDRLKAAGVAPEEVDFVMCTHLHIDHVGWNTKLDNGRWVPTFPNAKYVFSQIERDYWDPQTNPALDEEARMIFEDSVHPVIASGQDHLVADGDRLGDNHRDPARPRPHARRDRRPADGWRPGGPVHRRRHASSDPGLPSPLVEPLLHRPRAIGGYARKDSRPVRRLQRADAAGPFRCATCRPRQAQGRRILLRLRGMIRKSRQRAIASMQ
ncbi:MAG: MBL fold metallo-hydrolase [Rhodoblastus sp.]